MTIRKHPLAWRWTDPAYAVLPEDVLARMVPVGQSEAEHRCKQTRGFVDRSGLSARFFPTVVRQSSNLTEADGIAWLRAQGPDLLTEVTVSWDAHTAIRTTWEIFTAYWDDFCYPSSDDVVVFPDSVDWALFYFHEEEFQFGRKEDR